MNNLVPLKQLRNNLATYTERVEKNNENFIVIRKSKPVFRIVPIDEDVWETVVDFTSISPHGAPLAKVKAALARVLNK